MFADVGGLRHIDPPGRRLEAWYSHLKDAGCSGSRRATARPRSSASRRGSRPGCAPGPSTPALKQLVQREGLHTVCEEAGCPNIFECWEDREATFLIGGDQCTRRCDFCQIATGKPEPLDTDEPRRVAESVATMGLRYATVTGVARDDLPDGGAWLYAQTCREIHAAVPGCGVELLIPDFNADPAQLAEVFGARPRCSRTTSRRCRGSSAGSGPASATSGRWRCSRLAREAGLVTKSNLILGMGEERAEISAAMADLRAAGCDLLTITQYLRPSVRHHPVDRWVPPEEFDELARARPSGSASPGSCPGRWCARPTGQAGCTGRRSTGKQGPRGADVAILAATVIRSARVAGIRGVVAPEPASILHT